MNKQVSRGSYESSILLLQQHGFKATTFFDIGAAEGAFFVLRQQCSLLLEARHFFIDAMQENEPIYKKLRKEFNIGYEIAAISSLDGETTISIDPNFYNTQLHGLHSHTAYPELRKVPVQMLDTICKKHELKPPYALKIDVQGAELDVLRGAVATLKETSFVVVETSISGHRDNFSDLLAFMESRDFVLFDVTNLSYTPSAMILYQCYATFISKKMDFRANQTWTSSAEQETKVNEILKARRVTILEELKRFWDPENS